MQREIEGSVDGCRFPILHRVLVLFELIRLQLLQAGFVGLGVVQNIRNKVVPFLEPARYKIFVFPGQGVDAQDLCAAPDLPSTTSASTKIAKANHSSHVELSLSPK